MARVITITSGKGGVGKTSISLNLSLSLASKGFKVCLFDADLGLANVNILTGIYPKKDIASVINGQSSLNEIIIKDYQGIDIIPGSSGIKKIADLSKTQTGRLINAFLDLEEYDYFIFDTSAGISSQVISFCMASHEIILVATCEPTSLTDAYSLLKVLAKHGYNYSIRVVINQVKSGKEAQKAYSQLKTTVNKFLDLKVQPLGILASDKNVRVAVISQTPFFMLFPETIASKCIRSIRKKLMRSPNHYGDLPIELFWDRCLNFLEKQKPPAIDFFKQKEPSIDSFEQKQNENEIRTVQKKIEPDKDILSNIEIQHDQDIKKRLSTIESKLSSLIADVSDIKQLIKNNNLENSDNISKNSINSNQIQKTLEPKKMSLDFESWLEQNIS